jgi:uncharacterized protein (UPF0276 family)
MKTIAITDGKLSRDENGLLNVVEGAQKAAQDVPNVLLTTYNDFFDTGSTLTTINYSSDVAEVAIERAIYDSIFRLISRQINSAQTDRIIRIEKILTQRVDLTTIVYYVEVLHESGDTAEFATKLQSLTETQLNHLLDINKVYK